MVKLLFAVKTKGFVVLAFMLGLTILFATNHKVYAANDACTWTGTGTDTNITTAGNWTGCDNGHVPENGDSLIFPTGPTNKIVNLNTALFFDSVTFSGNGYTVNTTDIGNNQLFIDNNLTISGNNNTFNSYVRLFPVTNSVFTHSGTGTNFAHYIVLEPEADNTDVTLDIQSDLTLPMIAQTAPGGGSSIDTLNKIGSGTLDISGSAISGVFAGNGIHIEEGRWKCDSTFCLGNTANEIVLDEGGDSGASSLVFNYNGTVHNPITANAVTGDHSSLEASDDVTFDGAITMHDDLHFFVTGTHTATVSSNVSIDGTKTLTVYGNTGYQANAAIFNGNIEGTSGAKLIVDDAHVTLAGSNTYTGTTELFNTGGGAVVTVKDNNSLGNSSAGTVVNSGTTLEFDNSGDVTYDEPLTVAGTGVGGSYPGALVKSDQFVGLVGGVTLTGNTTWHNATAEDLGLLSIISGAHNINLTAVSDSGGFSLQPGGDNSFGDLVANGTQLSLYGIGNLVIPGNLTMNAVAGHASVIRLNNDDMIIDSSVITLNNDDTQAAELINAGVSETVGTIVGDGTISIIDSDGHFSLSNASGTFEGILQGYANSEIEIDGGTWTFAGRNVDAGNGYEGFYVNGGKFVADAADTSLGLSPFSMSAGTLGGTGIIGRVSVYSGTVSPGNSPGCLYPAGDVAFSNSSGYYNEQIQGDTVCSQYDELNASGTVYLNNAVLVVDLLSSTVLTRGHTYTIIHGSTINGTFNGLADGATVNVGPFQFRVNYNATTVTLTYIGDSATTSGNLSSKSDLANTGAPLYVPVVVATILTLGGLLISAQRFKYRISRK